MTVALLSVQNATAVTVKFLVWQSVPLPFGMVLALAMAGGLLLIALALARPPRQMAAAPEQDLDPFDPEDWD